MSLRLRIAALTLTSTLASLALLAGAALAAPVEVTFSDKDGALQFEIVAADGSSLSANSVDHDLRETNRDTPLHVVEIKGATMGPKRWLMSFASTKNDPWIKGILLRKRTDAAEVVQIRTRFLRRVPEQWIKQVRVEEEGGKVIISFPRPSTSLSPSASAEVAPTPAPEPAPRTQTPEVKRMQQITAGLSEKPSDEREQPIDRGSRTPPAPSLGQLPSAPPRATPPLAAPPLAPPPLAPPPLVEPATAEASAPTLPTPEPAPLVAPTPALSGPELRELPSLPAVEPAAGASGGLFDTGFSEPFSDRQLWLVAALFLFCVVSLVLLRLPMSLFFWRMSSSAKKPKKGEELSFKVLSRHKVNAQWNQEVLLVEVLNHTLLLGSSASGGLTLLAQLSPSPSATHAGAPRASHDRYAAPAPRYAPPYARASSAEGRAPRYDDGYQAPYQGDDLYASEEPAYDHGEGYEEGYEEGYAADSYARGQGYEQGEGYTLEMPVRAVPVHIDEQPTAERPVPAPPSLSRGARYAESGSSEQLSDINSLVSEVRDSGYRSTPAPAEGGDVSADDLLQKIRQLNKG